MVNTWKAGGLSSVRHGVLMLCLGMSLCVLGSAMTNANHDAFFYGLATGLSAICLPIAGVNSRVFSKKAGLGRSEPMNLFVGVSAITCWLIFWVIQSTFADIRLLAIVAALHGIFWGFWYVRLAFRFQGYLVKAIVLCVFGGTTSSLGIVLGTWTGLSRLGAITAMACYMTYIGMQLFITAVLLHRESTAEKEFVGWQERELQMESTRLEVAQYSFTSPPHDNWDESR